MTFLLKHVNKFFNKIFISLVCLVQILAILFYNFLEIGPNVSSILVNTLILLSGDCFLIAIYKIYSCIMDKIVNSICANEEAMSKGSKSFINRCTKTKSFILFFCVSYGISLILFLIGVIIIPCVKFSKIEKYQGRVIRTNDRILIETKTRTTESLRKEDYDLKNPVLCVEETYSSVRVRLSDRYYICDINFSRDKK